MFFVSATKAVAKRQTVDVNRVLSVTLALLCIASFGLSAPLLQSGPTASVSPAGDAMPGQAQSALPVGGMSGAGVSDTGDGEQASSSSSTGSGGAGAGSDARSSEVGDGSGGDPTGAATNTAWDQAALERSLSQSADGGLTSTAGGGTGGATSSESGATAGGEASEQQVGTETGGDGSATATPSGGSGSGESGAEGDDGGNSAGSGPTADCTRADATRLGLDGAALVDVVGDTCGIGPQEDPYWRVASYATYTGVGWAPSDAERRRPSSDYPASGQTVRLRYTVVNETDAAPVPWRPTAVSGLGGPQLTGAGVEQPATLENGTTFTAAATLPSWSPRTLQRAGRDYPDAVERRYTALPSDTPERLDRLSERVTRNASTPYESAVLVEQWLQTEKGYSTQIDRPDGTVATAFATEMERGYCMYFATTMVAMLRTQGVPARYVSGYSPSAGQTADGDLKIDRAKAHAWVEVYFPETGWVTFDPTPSDRETLRETGTTRASVAAPTAAPDFAPVTTDASQQSGGDLPPEITDVNIRYDGRVVPGNEIGVIVTADGNRVGDAVVTFNGKRVGRTDSLGRVRGVVPYVAEFDVDVFKARETSDDASRSGTQTDGGQTDGTQSDSTDGQQSGPRDGGGQTQDGTSSGGASQSGESAGGQSPGGQSPAEAASGGGDGPVTLPGSITIPDSTVLYHVEILGVSDGESEETRSVSSGRAPDSRASPSFAPVFAQQSDDGTRDLNTTIGLSNIETRTPGTNATIRAEIEGIPVRDATVAVDGVPVTTTDGNGEASVAVPYSESFTVTVTRGDARGERTYTGIDTDIDVTAPTLSNETVDTPGTNATVRADINGVAVPNATVRVAGDIVAQTDRDGAATVTVPYRNEYAIAVRRSGAAGRTAVRGTDLNVSLAVGDQRRPGREVRVRATVDGVPVRDATVAIGGQRVGETDADGVARVSIPYVREGPVTVRRAEASGQRAFAVVTDTALTIAGDPVPGREHRVTATLGGAAFRGAAVFVDGERRATTGENGTATVTVPYAERLNVTVRRGELDERTTAPLPTDINVTLSGHPIPTQRVTVNTTIAGYPVANATVRRGENGSVVARTAENGTFTATVPFLPPRSAFALTVTRGAASGAVTRTLLPFYGGLALLLVGVAGGLQRRYGLLGRAVRGGEATAGLTRRTVRAVVDTVLKLGEVVAAAGRAVVGVGRRVLTAVRDALRQAPTLLAGIAALAGSLAAWLRTLPAQLRRLPARLRAVFTSSPSLDADGPGPSDPAVMRAGDDESGPDEATVETVVDAWVTLAENTPRTALTETPARVATAATAYGYPTRQVRRITEAFQRVRYGHYSLDTDRLQSVTEAADTLRSPDEGDGDDPDTVGDREEGGDR